MDQFRAILAYVKLVERGSFTAAAEHLDVSISSVTKSIAQLEKSLHIRLVNRTTRRIALTDEGREYYERCRRILEDMESADLAMRQVSTTPRGRLHVLMPVAIGRLHIIPALPRFTAMYPDISLHLTLSDQHMDLIAHGIDVAIWVGEIPESSMIAKLLLRTYRLTCATPDYLRIHGRPATPDDLVRHTCLATTSWRRGRDWLFRTPEGDRTVPIRGNLMLDNGDAYREAALAGLGIAQAASYLFGEDVAAGRLEPVLGEYSAPGQDFWAVYPSSRHAAPKVTAFLRFVSGTFKALPAIITSPTLARHQVRAVGGRRHPAATAAKPARVRRRSGRG
ncbi:LysR family transcriptional regulator [Vineibacter terrae]|uniref:LysR family transcriptional regulator n=1 Tax=Vineibacter terrae TaxID=2586908 RepID=A0A5C8PBE8_9HYPH|nr:LysR family transcriptional regulator [Vineibacter terrae]TXL70576.1 LysR family transcriptional regulator [Vineibacter terrae]HEX2886017.1 LysR substrate-binding domain-containing protein [Vineibacter terrae]